MLDGGLNNLELIIVHGYGVRYSTILDDYVLRLLTLMDEKVHVVPIINNQVRSVTLTIILHPYQGIQDAVPVLLETLTLLVNIAAGSLFIMVDTVWSWV